jgi:toxin ParE1/3/4
MAHRLAPHAAEDLDSIWYYVAKESGSVDIANRLIDSITARFFLIATHPNIGRTRDNDFGSGSRSLPVGEYVIVYSIEHGDVLIHRVAHGRRDLDVLFKR